MYSKVKLIIVVGLILLLNLWLFAFFKKSKNNEYSNIGKSLKIHSTEGRYRLMPEYLSLRDQLADWILQYSDTVLKTKDLHNVPKPQIKGLKLVLARKGKIIQQYGEIISNYHKSNWLDQFVLGVRKKGKVFKSKSQHFFDRAWEWKEFKEQWGRLMVAKTGKTFKLWSIQGSPDFFIFIIYDLSYINEIQLNKSKVQKSSLVFQTLEKHPMRVILSVVVLMLICLVVIYPIIAFHLCRYDILLGICLFAMIIFVRDGVNYVMQDWFSSQEAVTLKQKRNQMSDVAVELLNKFRHSTDSYGRKVGQLFKQKVNWDSLVKNEVSHLNEISESNLFSDILLITTVGVWDLSNNFKSYSRKLIDIFAESTIKQLIDRDFTNSEKAILSGRAGIMDVWITEEKKGDWLSRSQASVNVGTFRYVSFAQNDYGLFWEEIVSSDKKFAGYLVLHNSTQEMLKTFIKSEGTDASWKREGLGVLLCDENDRILHQWGSISPEIENRFRMRQIDRLTKEGSNWIEVKLSHAAFGKKIFYIYADRSKSLAKLINQRRSFEQALDNACLISVLLLICISLRVKSQLSSLLMGLREVTNSKFGIQLKNKGWDETSKVIINFNHISRQLLENQKLSPFVAGEILALFRDEKGSLQREIRDDAVVLFSDIRSFTTLSEQQSPEEIVKMLNQYFEIWAETVDQYGGIIERFVGDAIQIIFFESKIKNTHQTAIECAIKVREKILSWNYKRQQAGKFEVRNGIGISSGTISFTILGNSVKRHFVSQGKPVFKAEELEAISAYGRSSCIVSDIRTMEVLIDQYDFESWNYNKQTVYELKE